jgi:hypothetical protein
MWYPPQDDLGTTVRVLRQLAATFADENDPAVTILRAAANLAYTRTTQLIAQDQLETS